MPKLFVDMTSEQANLCALVLSSSGIPYFTAESGGGWEVWVKEADVDAALAAVKRYFRENLAAAPSEVRQPEPPQKTLTGIWAALILAAVYGAVAARGAAPLFTETFAAASQKILAGEGYRTITALMLHADMVHLAGNLIGIALFGTAVCSLVRPGPGWLMILLSGIIGNAANAVLHRSGHVSLGASTAVFGAVGILSACQFWDKLHKAGEKMRAWLPLAGGLAFLAILGAGGQRVDLMAHLFGLLAGLLLGLAYSIGVKAPLSKRSQYVCWALTAGILTAGWMRWV